MDDVANEDESYDWADDEDLSWEETLRRLEQLTSANVVVRLPRLAIVKEPLTTAGSAEVIGWPDTQVA